MSAARTTPTSRSGAASTTASARQLARLQGRIAFEMLLERFARIDLLGGRPRFRNGIVLRGLESLPLRCRS